jgi:hypothetical protein
MYLHTQELAKCVPTSYVSSQNTRCEATKFLPRLVGLYFRDRNIDGRLVGSEATFNCLSIASCPKLVPGLSQPVLGHGSYCICCTCGLLSHHVHCFSRTKYRFIQLLWIKGLFDLSQNLVGTRFFLCVLGVLRAKGFVSRKDAKRQRREERKLKSFLGRIKPTSELARER